MLESRQISDYSREHPSEKLYHLDWSGKPFADFFVRSGTCTLVWPGSIDFSSIGWEALQHVPTLMGLLPEEAPHGDEGTGRPTARVSFIVKPADPIVCHLGDRDEFIRFRHLLDNPLALSFARFDVHLATWLGPVDYALTANNPLDIDDDPDEITITLSRGYPWSPELLAWVFAHHSSAHGQQRRRDAILDSFGSIIARLSRP